jgi:hypothetical protein
MSAEESPPRPSVFVLGPSLDDVIEPEPVAVPDAPAVPGRRQIVFDTPPPTPGGNVHLRLVPPAHPDDVLPINVYASFVQPVTSVPVPADHTPDWSFKSGAPSSSIHIGAADETGAFTAARVTPGLRPDFVPNVLEFQA